MLREVFEKAGRAAKSETGALIARILHARPDLAGEAFYVANKGKNGITLLTRDEVFKAPADKNSGLKERKILEFLHAKGLPVPEVTCVGADDAFFGMVRLPGERIGLLPADKNNSDSIRYQIGKFIADVETASLSADFAPVRALLADPGGNGMADRMREVLQQTEIRQAIGSAGLLRLLDDQVEKMASAPAVLLHNDLFTGLKPHKGNILVDTAGVCGFLDPGCAILSHSVYAELGLHVNPSVEDPLKKGYLENQTRRTAVDLVCEHFLERLVNQAQENRVSFCKQASAETVDRVQALGALKKTARAKAETRPTVFKA